MEGRSSGASSVGLSFPPARRSSPRRCAAGSWRAFWPSFVATVAFSLALAAVAFSAALLGFGLPVAISVARG